LRSSFERGSVPPQTGHTIDALAMMLIIGVIAELERGLIMERVCAGMRRAKLEGRQIGRPPLNIDRAAIMRDRGRKICSPRSPRHTASAVPWSARP
jgi:DNA invertase Pin-like site-specific DNA recombinase